MKGDTGKRNDNSSAGIPIKVIVFWIVLAVSVVLLNGFTPWKKSPPKTDSPSSPGFSP
jgi:hypothetical protein